MKPRLMSDVARAVDGLFLGNDVVVTTVCTDSRLATPGSLFVALPGEHTDGGLFVPEAFQLGAAGALVRDGLRVDGPSVSVRSTNEALIRLATDERRRSGATVVGVTGANGKTSTKDMTAAVLARRFRTHASPESFNNEVGLPVTLLTAPADTEVVVAEMGARRKGDVTLLCEIARPDVVVVTNVGVAHLEVYGSWEAIVEASAEPIDALGPEGVGVLNADDQVVAGYAARSDGRVVTFGMSASADVRADGVWLDAEGFAAFDVAADGAQAHVALSVAGEHMVSNALASIAVGLTLGIELETAAAAVSTATVSHWRMETFTTGDGVRVVNDAYNANPESVAAALKAARWMARDARLIAVLGTMAELGPIADEEHERLGDLAARLRVDRVIAVGDWAEQIATASVREGVEPGNVAAYERPEDALEDVRAHARAGDVVLFKASRVAGLERLAEALR
ncbi:MAG TPA: UDP-N-acetylmuramoyl-tripeptide--D-alanyl-D-alanine ligase [Actinomycetota bacterium]